MLISAEPIFSDSRKAGSSTVLEDPVFVTGINILPHGGGMVVAVPFPLGEFRFHKVSVASPDSAH